MKRKINKLRDAMERLMVGNQVPDYNYEKWVKAYNRYTDALLNEQLQIEAALLGLPNLPKRKYDRMITAVEIDIARKADAYTWYMPDWMRTRGYKP